MARDVRPASPRALREDHVDVAGLVLQIQENRAIGRLGMLAVGDDAAHRDPRALHARERIGTGEIEEIIAATNPTSSKVSCHTTLSAWLNKAGSTHLGVRMKGRLLVRRPDHTALPTAWVRESPATEAINAPFTPERTLGG